MENNRAILGALIFIVLVLGANFVLYAIAKGAARSNGGGFAETIARSIRRYSRKEDDSIDELRRRIDGLSEKSKSGPSDSE